MVLYYWRSLLNKETIPFVDLTPTLFLIIIFLLFDPIGQPRVVNLPGGPGHHSGHCHNAVNHHHPHHQQFQCSHSHQVLLLASFALLPDFSFSHLLGGLNWILQYFPRRHIYVKAPFERCKILNNKCIFQALA